MKISSPYTRRADTSPPGDATLATAAAMPAVASVHAPTVLVFLFLVLIDRQDLRDRLLRLLGGNLHSTTDAMDEAGTRISRYLTTSNRSCHPQP